MAIAPMKLVRIEGPIEQFDSMVASCIINRDFHPENAMEMMRHAKILRRMEDPNPFSEPLRKILHLIEHLEIQPDYRAFLSDSCTVPGTLSYFEEIHARFERMALEQTRLEKIAQDNEQILLQLEHFHTMNIEINDLFAAAHFKFRFGRIPRETFDNFSRYFETQQDFFFFETSLEKEYVYGLCLLQRNQDEKIDAFLASLQFERIYLSEKIHGTLEQAKEELQEEMAKSITAIDQIRLEKESLIRTEKDRLLSGYSYLRFMSDAFDIRKYAVSTGESFFLFGWVPSKTIKAFTKNIDAFRDIRCIVNNSDSVSNVTPPVKLSNPRIFRPFEPFLLMYGRPSYNEVDPTPLMAILYTFLFGMMFGDVGQGLILVGVGYLMWKVRKMWLGRVLIYTGFAGTAFGFFYGSVFGYEHLLPFGFKVLESAENINSILQTAVYIGFGVLILVMGLNILNGLKQKDYEKALFSQNGVFGLILYASIILLVLPMLGFLDANVSSPLFLLLGVLLPMIAVIFRHPLGKLVSGEKNWFPRNLGSFLLENLFELIEIFLSYISNTISFLRVGIFALSHAGMMMVVFLLAGEPANPVVIAVGNVVVMGIEGLLVGIQVLRLNFYEIFGRFFSAEGVPFEPIVVAYKNFNLNETRRSMQ